jgi:hypothetical protein
MRDAEREYLRIGDWARRRLPPDAVVISRKPSLFYAASGLKGRVYPLSNDSGAFFARARSIHARYVVLDDLDGVAGRYLAPVMLNSPQAFCAEKVEGETMLMRIVATPPPASARPAKRGFVPCTALGLPTATGTAAQPGTGGGRAR